MIIKARSEYEGFFKLRVWDRDMQLKRETDWFPNLITNMGLDSLGLNTALISSPGFYKGRLCCERCWIGSAGTPAPAFTDTAMNAVLAPTAGAAIFGTPSRGVQTILPYYARKTFTYRFTPTGSIRSVRELGTFFRTGSSGVPAGLTPNTDYMFNHALVLDGLGNPTVIDLQGDETLDVIYELRVYPLQADTNYSVTITNVGLVNCTMRACRLNTNDQANNVGDAIAGQNHATGGSGQAAAFSGVSDLGPITGTPTGGQNNPNSVANQILAYTPGSYNRTVVYRWDLTDGSSSFTCFECPSGTGNVQVKCNPVIPKTSANILILNVNFQWARRDPL